MLAERVHKKVRESENLSAELNHENAKKNDGSFLSSVMTWF